MTYLVTYYLRGGNSRRYSVWARFEKRGSFIVEAETCEEAETKARVVLADAIKYGMSHGMPDDVYAHIASVLPTLPREPSWEDVVAVSAAGRNRTTK